MKCSNQWRKMEFKIRLSKQHGIVISWLRLWRLDEAEVLTFDSSKTESFQTEQLPETHYIESGSSLRACFTSGIVSLKKLSVPL